MITIRKVLTDKDKNDFIKLPWKIYKDNKYWVPPLLFDIKNNLDKTKNPFFKHAEMDMFLADKDGELVGRIAAIKNDNHNSFHNDKTGFFGFFECINDTKVSGSLFNTAIDWCKNKGLDKIMGPMNPSTNDECGLLIDGFDSSPLIMMPYNEQYYLELIEASGFIKEMDLLAYRIRSNVINDDKLMAKLERVSRMIKSKYNITVRNLRLSELDKEILIVQDIYNDAWEMNWGFVPMTREEFEYAAKSLKTIVDPDFVFFAEIDGNPVGFSLTLPDINQILKKINGRLFPLGIFKFISGKKKINDLRVITMGVKKEYQKRGIDSIFYIESIKMANIKKINGAEISWVLENNYAMRQTAEKLGANVYKTYRILSKNLN